jgi:formyltetrahydrofolate deformylase
VAADPTHREHSYVLTLACPDRTGIVARISGFLAELGAWITEAAYHSDPESGRFFTRQEVRAEPGGVDLAVLRDGFAAVAAELRADHWRVTDTGVAKRVVVLVSKEGHCLYDLLSRWHAGELDADITRVVGNHADLAGVAAMFGVPFAHVAVPSTAEGKAAAFARIAELVDADGPDAVVLARFMQVVPPDLCLRWAGRLINIHHGFLPGFSGARPYHQAHRRGVKIIGATCHYVTEELDDGPIIEQDVIRVDHADSAAAMARRGRDIEKVVLARGLANHLQDRVLLDGRRTVILG